MKGWDERPLRAYSEIRLGRQRSPENSEGPHMIRYLRAANVQDGSLDLTDVKVMNFTPEEQAVFSLRSGDVLVTEGSGSLSSVGASAVWREELSGVVCFQNTLIRLRPRSDRTDGRFLGWWARHAFADGLFAAIATGANIHHVSAERVRDLRMRFPPLDIQRAIADFLDAETARIDALIAKKSQLIQLLDARFVATVDERTKDLTPTPLRRVAEVAYGLGQPPPLSDDGVPILRATNVSRGVIESIDLIRSRLSDLPLGRAPLLEDGDIIVVRSGANTGDSALITGEWVGAAPGYDLRVRPTAVDPRFLAVQMLGRRFLDQVDLVKGRAAQPHLNAEELGNATVMVASSSSAERSIGRALTRLDECRRGAQQRLTHQIDLLVEHRQALITAAVTGELDVAGAIAEEAS